MSTRAEYSRELVASHPSYFELDTLFLDDSLVSSAVQQHVASCRQCRHYVQELRTISNSPLPSPMRERLRLPAQPTPVTRRPAWFLRVNRARAAGTALVIAAAAAIPLLLLPRPRDRAPLHSLGLAEQSPSTHEKGSVSTAVYVQRGQQVLRWEEGTVIHSGDKLRLEVSPWTHTHGTFLHTYVSVATASSSEASAPLRVLFRGTVEKDSPLLLPASWEVDDQGHHESLVVVWSHQPLRADSLTRKELAASANSTDYAQRLIWRELVLPKE